MAIDSLGSWQRSIEASIRAGKLDAALEKLVGVFFQLGTQPTFQGRSLALPQFDALCQDVGEASCYALFGEPGEPVEQTHDVVLITELTVQGGHGEIVRDLIALNDIPVMVVVTDLHNRPKPILTDYLTDSNIIGIDICPGPTMLSRLQAAQQRIARPSVRRIFMLHHGYDAIATAAATRDLGKPIYYLHHCDTAPALGCHLENVVHVDLHNIAFHRCRFDIGIAENRYLALTARPRPLRMQGQFAHVNFKTASCGGEHKLQRLPYAFGYVDMVTTILKYNKGQHFHIGPLSKEFVTAVHDRLTQNGIEPNRFIHVGEAPHLADILHYLEIDLYVPTLPQGGGKAMIDAMSVGVPVLVHENAIDRMCGSRDLVYPEALSWRSLTELATIIETFDAETWREQTAHATRYFQQNHAPECFRNQLSLNDMSPAVPALKPYRPDADMQIKYGLHHR